MTKTKAISILQRHGFELKSPLMTTILYQADILHPVTGSHLHGRIYEDSLYINRTLEPNKAPRWFNFGQGSTSTAFAIAVEQLAEELNRYEETLRNKRVENVKQYFKSQELKRVRRNDLISIVKRVEHLSREEL